MNKGKGFGIGNQTKREQKYIAHHITLEALLNLTTEEAFKWIASRFSKRHTLTSFKQDIDIWYTSEIQSKLSLAIEHKRRGKFKKSLKIYNNLFQQMPTWSELYRGVYKTLAISGKLDQAERSIQINALLLSLEYAFTGAPFSFPDDYFNLISNNPSIFLAFWTIEDPNLVKHLGAIALIRQGGLTKQSVQAYLNNIQGKLPINDYPDRTVLANKGKEVLIQLPWHIISEIETPNNLVNWLRELTAMLSYELGNLLQPDNYDSKERLKSYLMDKILGLSKNIMQRESQLDKNYWEDVDQEYSDLMILLFINIIQSGSDRGVVYPFLLANLENIDNNFAKYWHIFLTTELSKKKLEQTQGTAAYIALFSMLMQEFPQGNQANNIEIAIAGYEAVSTVYTCEASPQAWANLQHNFGDAYLNRIRGDQAENLEKSIQYYNNALGVYKREIFPELLAKMQC
ncbi:MAG: hypothetical protein RIM23_18860 [Coleofasciculus sp. G3-WIS-01]|uniref:hypothetical protein n=1 Tax=Coleofasciculus sp. G3-WIS-01 TaxID=3069528 RepID=UPI0032FE75DE